MAVQENSTRRVLVTGASKGIGRAVARRLAQAGFDVGVHFGTDEMGATQTIADIEAEGGRASLLGFDVRDRERAAAVLNGDIEARGAYWGLVSNAGITRDKPFPAIEGEDWDSVLRTSLDGFYNVAHPLIMPMIRLRSGGRIVVLSSVSGVIGNRGQVNYSAAKAGLIGAAKALAMELASRHITVNAVAPGVIETQMTENVRDEVMKSIPMKRAGTVDEVAGAVAYLFSDDAAYVTRQVLGVNGGLA